MCLFKECVKFIVFAFNLIFLIIGAALITIGTLYQVNFKEISKAIPEAYNHLELIPILTIVVGSIIFLISFFGCCGAIRGSSCLLTTYAVILLIIFVGQIALGVFAFLEIKNTEDLSKSVNNTIKDVFIKDNELVDLIQEQLQCCGTTGPDSWSNLTPGKDIPSTCYPDKDKKQTMYKKGCQNAFYDFLKDAAQIIGIVVLALAATEVIGATFSLCLANSVRNEMRRNNYY